MKKLLSPFHKNGLELKNHLVMAPMTRSRAIDNIPNDLMAEYYGQRAGAGLIVTEGTSPTADGLGYPRIPGIFSKAQIDGWKKVTKAVHDGGSKVFIQLMHTGRIGHQDNLPDGAELLGPSSIPAAGQIYTDAKGMQEHSAPIELTTERVKEVIKGFMKATENAIEAGFDGVEFHGANGYLIEQFLNPNVNTRTDEYGGSIQKRAALTLEMVAKSAALVGKEKIGIRFSPYSVVGDLQAYDPEEVHETYTYLATELSKIGIAYIHINLNEKTAPKTLYAIRNNFKGTIIQCSGFTAESGENALKGNL
ncbi:MAG TPA: alkene reductase, partial [Puia sp.]|nr:alkene reductase [Puia sp.]